MNSHIKTIGKYTYGSNNIILYTFGENTALHIGSFCSIAKDLKIFLGGNHRTDWVTTYPFGHIHKKEFPSFGDSGHPRSNGDVVIGNDVWIGSHVTIMSGITIGDGAVIAANTHVVKDVPSYCIVGGNPSKIIKKRFSEKQIQSLLQIKWWDWEDEEINENCSTLCSENIQTFIDLHLPNT